MTLRTLTLIALLAAATTPVVAQQTATCTDAQIEAGECSADGNVNINP